MNDKILTIHIDEEPLTEDPLHSLVCITKGGTMHLVDVNSFNEEKPKKGQSAIKAIKKIINGRACEILMELRED